MAPIKTRSLEINIISGDNLLRDHRNPAMTIDDMYVVVRTESIKCWSTKMGNQEAENGSTLWNDKLNVEMPWHAKSITLEVYSKTPKGVVRSIGLARIAIWDVLPKEEGCCEVLSYRLKNWNGRSTGVINFSVKLNKEEKEEENTGMMISSCEFNCRSRSATRIPVCWIHPCISV